MTLEMRTGTDGMRKIGTKKKRKKMTSTRAKWTKSITSLVTSHPLGGTQVMTQAVEVTARSRQTV
jgi:hypothetical protein